MELRIAMCSMRPCRSRISRAYAFSKLNAMRNRRVLRNCRESFNTEKGRLDAAIERIRNGNLLAEVLASETASATDGSGSLKNVPMHRVVTCMPCGGTRFPEGLKNYRDLAYMGSCSGLGDSQHGSLSQI